MAKTTPPPPPSDQTPPPPPPPPPMTAAPVAPPPPPFDLAPYAGPLPQLTPAEERTWSTLIHVAGIWGGWLTSLTGYLMFRERGPYIRHNAVSALNFHLTMLLGMVVGWILTIVFIGILVILAVIVLSIVFGIMAAVATHRGQYYRYPIAIPFVR